MVNESDNTKNEESNVAQLLYRQYRRERNSSTTIARGVSASNLGELVGDELAAEKVYLRYQEQRRDKNELAIDHIMQIINDQALLADNEANSAELIAGASVSQPIAEQVAHSAAEQNIQPIDATTGQVVGKNVQQKPAANSTNWFKRAVLPAIAAAVLGIALIPKIINQSAEPQTLQASLPAVLLENAEQSVSHLNPPAVSAFGFTDSGAAQNLAFQYGVALTEIELLIESGGKGDTVSYVEPLIEPASDSANDLAETETVSTAAIALIGVLEANAKQSQLNSKLDKLRAAVEASVQEQKQVDWYSTGQSVEAVRIAAEYSLEHSDTTAIEQALAGAALLDYPQDKPALVPMLDTLAAAKLSPPDEFEQTSQILGVVQNIKVLMQ